MVITHRQLPRLASGVAGLTGCNSYPAARTAGAPPATTMTAAAASVTGASASTSAAGRPVQTPKATVRPIVTDNGASVGAASQVAAARVMLAALNTGGRGPMTGYVRTAVFGPAWADVNRNGCGTRDDILARDLTGVGKRSNCVVTSGTLHDPYTGATITFHKADAAAVQIDHVVPLGLAWQLGAAQWPQGERGTFANDPANLLAVDGPANESKSDSGPDSWLPPNKAYRCTYAVRFTRVLSLYRLRLTTSMRAAINTQLASCTSVDGNPATLAALPQVDWDRAGLIGGPRPPSPTTTKPAPATTSKTSVDLDPRFATCKAAKAAGYGPYYAGKDLEYQWYRDADGDGEVCE